MCKQDSLTFALVLGTLIPAIAPLQECCSAVSRLLIASFPINFFQKLPIWLKILLPLVSYSSHSLEKSIPFKIFNILPLISTLLGGDPIHQQTGGHMTGDCLLSSSYTILLSKRSPNLVVVHCLLSSSYTILLSKRAPNVVFSTHGHQITPP